jgi:hypothetical protein
MIIAGIYVLQVDVHSLFTKSLHAVAQVLLNSQLHIGSWTVNMRKGEKQRSVNESNLTFTDASQYKHPSSRVVDGHLLS